jgi:hypothetical protein
VLTKLWFSAQLRHASSLRVFKFSLPDDRHAVASANTPAELDSLPKSPELAGHILHHVAIKNQLVAQTAVSKQTRLVVVLLQHLKSAQRQTFHPPDQVRAA